MMRALTHARRLGGLLVIAAVCALAWRTARDGSALAGATLTIRPLPLAASLALEVAVLAAGVLLWGRVLGSATRTRPRYPVLLAAWWRSSVSRYLPGRVWPFVSVELTRGATVPRGSSAASLAVHSLLALAASALVGIALGGARLRAHEAPRIDPRIVLAACAVCPLLWMLGRRARALVMRALHPTLGATIARAVRDAQLAPLFVLHVAAWLVHGVALFVFIQAIVPAPLPLAALPAVIAAGALAAGAGTMLGVAPAGLGVREAVLGALLAAHLPLASAALVAVAARLWATAAELLLGVVAFALSTRAARAEAAHVAAAA